MLTSIKLYRKSGFTLLEIMVSLAIMSIALVTLLTAHNRAILLNSEAGFVTDASMLAREEMARLYIGNVSATPEPAKKNRDDYPGYSWVSTIGETPFPGVLEAEIAVFRNENKNPLMILKSYIVK